MGGDGYHYWDFADPAHEPAGTDNMAPFQVMALADDIAGEPLITLNFGSGSAAEAADYVTHLVGTDGDDPRVAARAHWGDPDPYPAGVHELGNEVYGYWNTGYSEGGDYAYANPDAEHGGDPAWHGQPSSDPADCAARALASVEAVAAVSPDARFWTPLSQADMDGWGGLDAALPALEPLLLHPAVTAVVIQGDLEQVRRRRRGAGPAAQRHGDPTAALTQILRYGSRPPRRPRCA